MKKSILILIIFLFNKGLFAEIPILKATTSSFPPFAYEKQNKIEGFEVENIHNIFRKLGYNVTVKLKPLEESIDEIKDQNYDFLFLLRKTRELEKLYYFSNPTVRLKNVFYKKRDKEFYYKKLNSFQRYRVGVSTTFTYEPKIQKMISEKMFNSHYIYGHNVDLQGLLKTAFGQIDFFICYRTLCDYEIRKFKNSFPELEKLDYVDPNINEPLNLYLAFPKNLKNSEALVRDFNRELLDYKESYDHRMLLKKYEIINDRQ